MKSGQRDSIVEAKTVKDLRAALQRHRSILSRSDLVCIATRRGCVIDRKMTKMQIEDEMVKGLQYKKHWRSSMYQ